VHASTGDPIGFATPRDLAAVTVLARGALWTPVEFPFLCPRHLQQHTPDRRLRRRLIAILLRLPVEFAAKQTIQT
jgi:hypothetical protein